MRELSRSRKALYTSVASLALEVVNVLVALIVPRVIMATFGSEANGLAASITQFVGYLMLLRIGIGGVLSAAMYEPLAYRDTKKISAVVNGSKKLYLKITYLSCVYIAILAVVYPLVVDSSFDYLYVGSMVLIVSASTLVQCLIGMSYQLLPAADQKGYVTSILQIATSLVNMLLVLILVKCGCSYHVVKLGSAVVFILQPIVLKMYVSRHYQLDPKEPPKAMSTRQRKAGFIYSLSDFIHRRTDIFILTLVASLKDISVYSVYSVVTNGITAVITMATGFFQSALGNMLAKKEDAVLKDTMNMYVCIVHALSAVVFAVAINTICPFVAIYTADVADADYIQPLFAVLILVAEMFFCLRQPYQSIIQAAGHFEQTKGASVIEAVVNLGISLLLVRRFGLPGVAFGTLCGMVYRTVSLMRYVSRNILKMSFWGQAMRYLVTLLNVLLVVVITKNLVITSTNFIQWGLNAAVITVISIAITGVISFAVYPRVTSMTLKRIIRLVQR